MKPNKREYGHFPEIAIRVGHHRHHKQINKVTLPSEGKIAFTKLKGLLHPAILTFRPPKG